MDTSTFTLLALSTWRLSHLLAHEDGPLDAFRRLRILAGAFHKVGSGWESDRFAGKLLICPLCLSVWVAALLCGVYVPLDRYWPLAWLAVSGASCILELAVRR